MPSLPCSLRRRGLAVGQVVTLLAALAAICGLTGCRSRATSSSQAAPSASAVPKGFKRIAMPGWTLTVPGDFEPQAGEPPSPNVVWLLNSAPNADPDAPQLLFGRYTKPATFPSRVYGLMALDGLAKEPRKRVVESRQHSLYGTEVTDIEVAVDNERSGRHQWRRMFVYEGSAYFFSYSVTESAAPTHRPIAELVRSSLAPAPSAPAH